MAILRIRQAQGGDSDSNPVTRLSVIVLFISAATAGSLSAMSGRSAERLRIRFLVDQGAPFGVVKPFHGQAHQDIAYQRRIRDVGVQYRGVA